jgi:glycosyltransferase involved in cell wall biosynthesis
LSIFGGRQAGFSLRVAHVAPYDSDGGNGVARAVLNWARVLPDLNIDVEIWDFSPSVTSVIHSDWESCQVFRLPCYANRLRGMFSLPEETRRFLSLRAKKVDALHLHSVFRPENYWVARLGLPFVISPHNGYHSDLLKRRSRWKKLAAGFLWERSHLNRAHTVLALNGRECEDLQAYGITTKMLQLPNILGQEVLTQMAAAPPPGYLWVFIGRLDVDLKGLDTLLKGFALFRTSTRARGSRLVIAGPDFRDGLARLKSLAEQCGISGYIDFPGPTFGADKLALLERTAVFVHPSRVEGIPYAVLEALAYGRPVLLTRSTNLSEIVASHNAGWLVEHTPESVAQAFHQIEATTLEELQAMGESALALVRSEFQSDPIARRLASVYRELVA